MISYIVPKSILQNAISWHQGSWLTASVVGHALGGFLIAFFNTKLSYFSEFLVFRK